MVQSFNLRITISGLIAIATDSHEVHLLFPDTDFDPSSVAHHEPKLAYLKKYSKESPEDDFRQDPIRGLYLDWSTLSDQDPPRLFVPAAVLDLSKVESARYSRKAAQGNSDKKLVAHVCLHHGGFVACEPGLYFRLSPSQPPQEASWVVQWQINNIQSDHLDVIGQILDGETKKQITTLYPIDGLIDVVLWHAPASTPMRSKTNPHFKAIYRLLGSKLLIPTLDPDDQTPSPNHHFDFRLPPIPGPHVLTEAFQCYPGAATLLDA